MLSLNLGPINLPIVTLFTMLFLFIFYGLTHLYTKSQVDLKQAKDKIFNAVLAGLVVARITFVISMWEIYQQDFMSIVDIRDGGFNNFSGWFAGIIYLIMSAKGSRELVTAYVRSASISFIVMLPFVLGNALLPNERTITDFIVFDETGAEVSLVEFEGKPTVINFWASWCPPCIREMPILEAAQKENSEYNFVFLNQQEGPSKVVDFLAREKLSLNNVYFDLTGAAAIKMGSFALPTTLFFDETGKLVSSHMGELSKASLSYYLNKFKKTSK